MQGSKLPFQFCFSAKLRNNLFKPRRHSVYWVINATYLLLGFP